MGQIAGRSGHQSGDWSKISVIDNACVPLCLLLLLLLLLLLILPRTAHSQNAPLGDIELELGQLSRANGNSPPTCFGYTFLDPHVLRCRCFLNNCLSRVYSIWVTSLQSLIRFIIFHRVRTGVYQVHVARILGCNDWWSNYCVLRRLPWRMSVSLRSNNVIWPSTYAHCGVRRPGRISR